MIVHLCKELPVDRAAKAKTYDRINGALRAERRIATVKPISNIVGWKGFQTMEATA
jgi:hypothetical protein